jgi:hypothetical protein
VTEDYFNATNYTRGTGIKVYWFTDNPRISEVLATIKKPPKVTYGRYGYTELPVEVKEAFLSWFRMYKTMTGLKSLSKLR